MFIFYYDKESQSVLLIIKIWFVYKDDACVNAAWCEWGQMYVQRVVQSESENAVCCVCAVCGVCVWERERLQAHSKAISLAVGFFWNIAKRTLTYLYNDAIWCWTRTSSYCSEFYYNAALDTLGIT